MRTDEVGSDELALIELYEHVDVPATLWPLVNSRAGTSVRRRWRLRFASGLAVAGLALAIGLSLHHMSVAPPAVPAASKPSQDVFSIPFPDETGFPPGTVRHHSGGPYVSQVAAAQAAMATLGCSVGTAQADFQGTRCDSASTKFFSRYDDGWGEMGPGWGFVNAWGPDREVYYVTVHGLLKFTPRTPFVSSGIETDHWNVQIDATTGEVMSTGTSGAPLP